MIVPITSSISREAIITVPAHQREAALALGATGWETIRVAVLPYARSGIFGTLRFDMKDLPFRRYLHQSASENSGAGNVLNPVLQQSILKGFCRDSTELSSGFTWQFQTPQPV